MGKYSSYIQKTKSIARKYQQQLYQEKQTLYFAEWCFHTSKILNYYSNKQYNIYNNIDSLRTLYLSACRYFNQDKTIENDTLFYMLYKVSFDIKNQLEAIPYDTFYIQSIFKKYNIMVSWKIGDEPKNVSLWLDNISYFYEDREYVEYPLSKPAIRAIKNIRCKLKYANMGIKNIETFQNRFQDKILQEFTKLPGFLPLDIRRNIVAFSVGI